jgi:hypothetical protein
MNNINDTFNTAVNWWGLGQSVIPLVARDKKPDTNKLRFSTWGKWEVFQTRLPTPDELIHWFGNDHPGNIGLIMGHGLVVIDFDIQDVFYYWLNLYPVQTYMVKTGRGVHVYIKTEEPAKNYHSDLLDIKANGGYVVIPPSVHPSGEEYQVLNPSPILNIKRLTDVLPEYLTPAPQGMIHPASGDNAAQYEMGQVGAGKVNLGSPAHHPESPLDVLDRAYDPQQHDIQWIKDHYSILDFIPGAHRTSNDGRWYMALCPFHEDHSPSFWIDTYNGYCGCHKCNFKNMDVINLVARLNHISNRDAFLLLANG